MLWSFKKLVPSFLLKLNLSRETLAMFSLFILCSLRQLNNSGQTSQRYLEFRVTNKSLVLALQGLPNQKMDFKRIESVVALIMIIHSILQTGGQIKRNMWFELSYASIVPLWIQAQELLGWTRTSEFHNVIFRFFFNIPSDKFHIIMTVVWYYHH
jgi:hypothetical protein